MAANPLTYQEIDTFDRRTFAGLSAWDIELICRLDDAVLFASQEKAGKADRNAPHEPVPVDNVKGLKALFRGMAVKKAAKG